MRVRVRMWGQETWGSRRAEERVRVRVREGCATATTTTAAAMIIPAPSRRRRRRNTHRPRPKPKPMLPHLLLPLPPPLARAIQRLLVRVPQLVQLLRRRQRVPLHRAPGAREPVPRRRERRGKRAVPPQTVWVLRVRIEAPPACVPRG